MTEPAIRRVTRIRHEVRRRDVTVTRTERLTPSTIAITLAGDALDGFRSDGFDDHVKFFFADAGGERVGRDYTPRRFDTERRELTIEFVLHEVGPASDWAKAAVAGTPATIGGPKSSMVIPADYAWHVLAGDAAALPAIARRLEELPTGVDAIVLAALDPADRRPLASAATLDLTWLDADADLAAALANLALPAGEGFIWCAGEAGAMARVRDVLLKQRGVPRETVRVAAYWKRDEASFHATLESGLERTEPV